MKFFRSLFRQFALDLGTARSRILVQGSGLVLTQPTCLVTTRSGEVLATGDEAVEIAGRQNQDVQISWPVREGVVADQAALLALLKIWLRPHVQPAFLVQPTVLVSVPAESSTVSRSNIRNILNQLGAVEIITIAQPLAAAIGAGVHTGDATGSFFLHLGHGVVEAGVVSLGSIMVSQQSVMAGLSLGQQIHQVLQNEHEIVVDGAVIEQLKQTVFSFLSDAKRSTSVVGKSVVSHRPMELEVRSSMFTQLADVVLHTYVELLYRVLEQAPPALLVDSLDKGLLLSGGLAQLHGLDSRLSDEFTMPVSVVEDPEVAVVNGMSQVLAHLSDFRHSLSYHAESDE